MAQCMYAERDRDGADSVEGDDVDVGHDCCWCKRRGRT